MAKRTATSDLNHDNWDREDEPEDAGTFAKASEDDLKKRVIKVARRRNPISSQGDESKPNAFGSFGGFAKTTSNPTPSASGSNMFGFLSNLTKPNLSQENGTSQKKGESASNKTLNEYYSKLKGLNESVSEWIKKHVCENPLVNLQPIFKDYEKYFAELEQVKHDAEKSSITPPIQQTSTLFQSAIKATQTSGSSPTFSFSSTTPKNSATSQFSFGVPKSTEAPPESLSFASTMTASSGSSGIFGNSFAQQSNHNAFTFGGPTSTTNGKFSFTSTVLKPVENKAPLDGGDEENESDEPPKVEFTPVVEDGHIYTIRCKVFVKNRDSYGDRGVGNLFLKPVPDSEKVQLIVRADTNLGNLICNFILSSGIPIKRMGKKDVMLVCLPTPDTKPPPVPILLRVKTPEDADELFKILEKHQK